MSLRGIIQDEVFEAKDKELRDKISKVKAVNKDAQERDKNWYEIVGRTLKTLHSAKEQMQSAMSVGGSAGQFCSQLDQQPNLLNMK